MKKTPFLLLYFCLGLSLTGFSQASTTIGAYKSGSYYAKDGTREDGLLQHTFGSTWGDAPDNAVFFKASAEAKPQKLTVQEISAFVINQDSFIVKNNFDINDHDKYAQDFVRVVKSGPISLYLHYTTSSTQVRKNVLTYLVEKDGELYRMIRPSNFTEQFPLLIADHKELIRKVKNKDYRLEDMQQVIDEYNQWHAQKGSH